MPISSALEKTFRPKHLILCTKKRKCTTHVIAYVYLTHNSESLKKIQSGLSAFFCQNICDVFEKDLIERSSSYSKFTKGPLDFSWQCLLHSNLIMLSYFILRISKRFRIS